MKIRSFVILSYGFGGFRLSIHGVLKDQLYCPCVNQQKTLK